MQGKLTRASNYTPQLLFSSPCDALVEQGLQKVPFRIELPVTLFAVTRHFILEEIAFSLNEIPYKINKFSSLRNLNLSILTTPKLNFYDNGFVNCFEDSLFADLIGFNYFYFDVDICDPKNFSLKYKNTPNLT